MKPGIEQSMNRVSGWYKRTSQIRVFVLAALVTLLMNADSLKMLEKLWSNPTLSAVVVEDAKGARGEGEAGRLRPGNVNFGK